MGDKTSISIYEFILISNYLDNSSGANISNVLSILGYNPKLSENDKSKELQAKCKELGALGWAICPFWEVNTSKGETIPYTWYEKTKNNKIDKIAVYFTKNKYKLLINTIGHSRLRIPTRLFNWINEAETLFFRKEYIPCAMMLTAILEGCIRDCPVDFWKRQITGFYESAVTEKIRDIYIDEYDKLSNKFYEFLIILPSLDGFIESFFDGKKPFEKKIEPDYLERNWLMHGMTERTITEIDCIKLFNVIGTLSFLTEILKS